MTKGAHTPFQPVILRRVVPPVILRRTVPLSF